MNFQICEMEELADLPAPRLRAAQRVCSVRFEGTTVQSRNSGSQGPGTGPDPIKSNRTGQKKGRSFALTCRRPIPQSAKSSSAASAAAHCHPLQLGVHRPGSTQPTMARRPQVQPADPDPPPAHPSPQAQAQAFRSPAPELVPMQPGKRSLRLLEALPEITS